MKSYYTVKTKDNGVWTKMIAIEASVLDTFKYI